MKRKTENFEVTLRNPSGRRVSGSLLRSELTGEQLLLIQRREKEVLRKRRESFKEARLASFQEHEEGVLRRHREIHEDARLVILGRLADMSAETFTSPHLGVTLAQIDAGIWAMIKKFQLEVEEATHWALDDGVTNMFNEIEWWDKKFPRGPMGFDREMRLPRVTEPEKLIVEKFTASLNAYGNSLIEEIRRRLTQHLAMQSNWNEMAMDVAGKLRESAITGTRRKTEQIVRTAVLEALGAGRQAALEKAAEVIPGLKRQWDSMLDEPTSDVCTYLHGKVVDLHEPWKWEEREIERPPANPNCRATVLPYHDDWLGDDAD